MSTARVERREVPADLVEATPGNGGLGHWLLAAPLLLFLLWLWVDFFVALSPLPLVLGGRPARPPRSFSCCWCPWAGRPINW